jgi:hypothetical protein
VPRLGPPGVQLLSMRRGKGVRGAWPASAAQRPWRGHLAHAEERGHLAEDGRMPACETRPTGVAVQPKVRRPGGNAETRRRRDVMVRARRRAGTFQSSLVRLVQTVKS